MKKKYKIFLLSAAFALAGAMTVFADDEVKIDKVPLKITCNPIPEAEAEPGTVTVTTASQEFTVQGAEYTNDVETWVLGDEPVVLVELEAKNGYRFSYTSKSHFEISGDGASFKKAKIYDSGSYMEVEIELDQITGKLGPVEYVDWDGRYAWWDRLEGAKSYEVRLYRNGNTIGTYKTSRTSYDFAGKFTKAGEYKFRVRGVADYNGRAGEWSEYSEEYDLSTRDINRINGFANSGSSNDRDDWKDDVFAGDQWQQNPSGWRYRYANGTYASGWLETGGAKYYFGSSGYMVTGWQLINGSWYYFDSSGAMQRDWQFVNDRWYFMESSGKMLTGWQNINNKWYYLNSSGAMLTGWQYINDKWYYLDSSGAMQTGWQLVNGRWYYMEGSGKMLTDWQFINDDWYYLDSSGAMWTGRQNINGKWYYLDGDGKMKTGWLQIDGRWYYMEKSGAALTGWQNINEKWYYLGDNGAMYVSTWTPDGWYVDANGVRTGEKR